MFTDSVPVSYMLVYKCKSQQSANRKALTVVNILYMCFYWRLIYYVNCKIKNRIKKE